jgi:hypothetical protein
MRNLRLFVVVVLSALLLSACAPSSFVRTSSVNWNTIELRDGVPYPDAWKTVVDTVGQRFDIEVLNQDSGYLRTGWDYKWTGELNEGYRVRSLVKFFPNMKAFQIRSEAEYRTRSGWVMGEDERLTQVLKTDLMGKLGRITK